jgi:quercetin dioxygenase-like cupin family protein
VEVREKLRRGNTGLHKTWESVMPNRLRRTVVVAALAGACGLAIGFAAAKVAYPPLDVLLKSGKTIVGQQIEYPAGTPEVTAAIVTLQPGQETGWHRHDAPLFAYMLDGELTVDYGADGSRVYHAGDAFLEAFRTEHNGKTTSAGPSRVLAVFMGAEGVKNTVMRGE